MTKLKPSDIKYLALEGGGGKGFAYLGALEILEAQGVLNHIDGYAGASAGAITSLLLSIGYSTARLRAFLLGTQFDTWWERETEGSRSMPELGASGFPTVTTSREESAAIVLAGKLAGASTPLVPLAVAALSGSVTAEPGASVIDNWVRMMVFAKRDMGFFPGQEPKRVFQRVIEQAITDELAVHPEKAGLVRAPGAMTFAEHFAFFNKRLILTATNLSTKTTEILSATSTPELMVADGVRMSMSLPFIFKPYVITKGGRPPCGTYVDGGVFNNLPFREFEGEGLAALFTPKKQGPGVYAVQNTFLLRLEIIPPVKIRSFADLFLDALHNGFFGVGESQVTSRYTDQQVILDTAGLGLVDFTPAPPLIDTITKRSRRELLRYFGLPVGTADQDAADDQASSVRRAASASACD
jgi:predicted acylesterase/phospholipase RssA